MIQLDPILIEFVKENCITLTLIYAVLKVIFPNSRILRGIGEAFSSRFPAFGKKGE